MTDIKEAQGLEVVAWRIGFPNNAGYKVYGQPQPWAYEQYGRPPFVTYEVQDLVRKSDADARDAMRLERIAELEAALLDTSVERNAMQRDRDQYKSLLGRECDDADAILMELGMPPDEVRTEGGLLMVTHVTSTIKNNIDQLRAELAAQEPVAVWRSMEADPPKKTGRYCVGHRGNLFGHAYYTANAGDTHYPVGWNQVPKWRPSHWLDVPYIGDAAPVAKQEVDVEALKDEGEQMNNWREHSKQFAKGVMPPQTIESLQAAWDRDQELIFEQKAEISKHKETINQLRQKLASREQAQPAADCGLEVVCYAIPVRMDGRRTTAYTEVMPFVPDPDVLPLGDADPLIRKSDADARDAMRLAEIAELKEELDDANSGCQKWYLEAVKRGKELVALKEQEPVGEMRLSELVDDLGIPVVPVELPIGAKLYAAPVAKQEVVK